MIRVTSLLVSLAFSMAAAAADAPRLALWITNPIGNTDASQCRLPINGPTSKMPESQPTLTELDVIGWNAGSAHWTLNRNLFSSANAIKKLQDHCFILAIDHKLISSGAVLSSYSERQIRFPTISVFNNDNVLDLRLTSSFHDHAMQPIHIDALNAVFGERLKHPSETKHQSP